MSAPLPFKKGGTYVNNVRTEGMTPDLIRQAVKDGKLVVAVDDAGISVQIDKALLARIDRRQKYFKPCTTSQNHTTPLN